MMKRSVLLSIHRRTGWSIQLLETGNVAKTERPSVRVCSNLDAV